MMIMTDLSLIEAGEKGELKSDYMYTKCIKQ